MELAATRLGVLSPIRPGAHGYCCSKPRPAPQPAAGRRAGTRPAARRGGGGRAGAQRLPVRLRRHTPTTWHQLGKDVRGRGPRLRLAGAGGRRRRPRRGGVPCGTRRAGGTVRSAAPGSMRRRGREPALRPPPWTPAGCAKSRKRATAHAAALGTRRARRRSPVWKRCCGRRPGPGGPTRWCTSTGTGPGPTLPPATVARVSTVLPPWVPSSSRQQTR
jgi:hypothetical protein